MDATEHMEGSRKVWRRRQLGQDEEEGVAVEEVLVSKQAAWDCLCS